MAIFDPSVIFDLLVYLTFFDLVGNSFIETEEALLIYLIINHLKWNPSLSFWLLVQFRPGDLIWPHGPIWPRSVIKSGTLLIVVIFDPKWPFLTPAKVHVKRESQGNNAMSALKDTSHLNHSKPRVLKVSQYFIISSFQNKRTFG